MDGKTRKLRSKEIRVLKVVWQNQKVEAATWKIEACMREHYMELVVKYLEGKS